MEYLIRAEPGVKYVKLGVLHRRSIIKVVRLTGFMALNLCMLSLFCPCPGRPPEDLDKSISVNRVSPVDAVEQEV